MNRSEPVSPAHDGRFPLMGDMHTVYAVGRTAAVDLAREITLSTDTVSVDTEGYGLGRDALDLKCVQIGTPDRAAVLDPRDPVQKNAIFWTIKRARTLIMHNSPFDVPVLAHNGLLTADDTDKVIDTLIWARLAEPDERTRKSLLDCANRYLGTDKADVLMAAFKKLGLSKAEGFKRFDLDRPIYVQGAAIDAVVTARLAPVVRKAALDRLTSGHPFSTYGVTGSEALELRDREQRVNQIMLRRTVKGLRVDFEYLDDYRGENSGQLAMIENELSAAGVDPGNGNQLARLLDEQHALPAGYPRTPKTGNPSTRAASLETLHHPLARKFVQHKQITKILGDYLQKTVDLADSTGRIHPQVNVLVAATGRMSAGNPPYQQFIGRARGIILAGDSLTSIDWSQIEPVVAANIAGESGPIMDGYEDGTSDMYTGLADRIKRNRKHAKVTLLAQLYGQGITTLAADLGIDVEEASDIRQSIFREMPRTAGLMRRLKNISREHGKVFTLSGRILTVPSFNGEVASYKGVNYFVQGSAYDILANSIVEVDRAGLSEAFYLAMHDELVVSSDAAHDIQKIMETPPARLCWMTKRTPVLRTDTALLGERWGDA